MAAMKTLNTLWLDDAGEDLEQEQTAELYFLGGLVAQPVAALEASEPLAEARRMLLELRVSAVVVVDADHTLLGLVTRTDALRHDRDISCGEAMSGRVITLAADSTIECAAALMVIEHVGQIVVTSPSGALVGLVSAVDIARHMAVRAGYLAG